jgi:hypothetical protein
MDHYVISDKLKRIIYGLMGVGVIALVWAIADVVMAHDDHHEHVAIARLWSNILIDGFFFFGIAATATFFLAIQYASEAGWAVVLKRILEALGSFMPVGGVILLVVFLGGATQMHHLWHWMDPAVTDPTSDHFDEIIAGKSPYLNTIFFAIRQILFIGLWVFFWRRLRKRSLEEDLGYDRSRHFKNVRDAAIFLVIFGYGISTFVPWDWIMSIDTHWFSTLFGWYVFSGLWISGMVMTAFFLFYLRSKGHLKEVNDSHIHDLGKWIFAISFLWSYLFFSQFMLIWYSNIPEEVTYFQARIQEYPLLYWGMFFCNFVLPMIALIDRDKKRNFPFMIGISVLVFAGHWLDTYMLVTPGTMKTEGVIGFIEIGMALGFLGLFLLVTLRTLSKAPLLTKNHPYFEESLHHEIH